ncbi:MAG: hypothetical protein KJT03_16630 [Verrucomicrobiae bacterium]|nr:hypothetical protein [Verrucomicrobiae bacterium]
MAANTKQSSSLSSQLAVAAALLVFAVLVYIIYGGKASKKPFVPPVDNPPPTAATLRAQEAEVLSTYGWVDKDKGIVRVPVEKAIELVVKEQNK